MIMQELVIIKTVTVKKVAYRWNSMEKNKQTNNQT